MIRNENVTIMINNTPAYPTNVQVTLGVGKGYNSASISGINLIGEAGESVVVTINTVIYNFIIDKKEYGKKQKVTLKLVGTPAILEDGSISDTEYTFIDSNELIETSRGVIPVINNIPNIIFTGQTYSKNGTAMSRIIDMVKIIGGQAFEIDGTLHLEPMKIISQNPTLAHTFTNNEIFDFAYSDERDTSTKVKQVLFNPITDDIYSETSIVLDYDDQTNKGEVFFNPSLSTGKEYEVSGIDARIPTVTLKTEIIQIDNKAHIKTLGGIDSINYITINGEPLEALDYVLYPTHNVIRFLTPKTGEVIISYVTKSIMVYVYRTLTFTIKYLCSRVSGTIEVDADNEVNNGACYAKIMEPLTYQGGGKMLLTAGVDYTAIFVEEKGATNIVTYKIDDLVGGGFLTIKYLYTTTNWVNTSFMNNFSSTMVTVIEAMTSEIIYDENLLKYVIYLDKPVQSINDIYFGSSLLSNYTYDDLGLIPYIYFDASDVGKVVDISMNLQYVEVNIPAPLVDHPVTLFDIITCAGVATQRFTLDENTLCSLPATFLIDVASLFSLEIHEVFGRALYGDFGTLIVNNLGKIEVTVTTATLHTITCDSIRQNGIITVDANGVI